MLEVGFFHRSFYYDNTNCSGPVAEYTKLNKTIATGFLRESGLEQDIRIQTQLPPLDFFDPQIKITKKIHSKISERNDYSLYSGDGNCVIVLNNETLVQQTEQALDRGFQGNFTEGFASVTNQAVKNALTDTLRFDRLGWEKYWHTYQFYGEAGGLLAVNRLLAAGIIPLSQDATTYINSFGIIAAISFYMLWNRLHLTQLEKFNNSCPSRVRDIFSPLIPAIRFDHYLKGRFFLLRHGQDLILPKL